VAASEDLSGPVNAVSPHPLANGPFSTILGRVLNRPAALRVPAAALRLLLASTRVKPARLLDSGFDFRYADLESALRHVLGRELETTP
jgi:NAD dependent epimerase/dehydratase family enzyme